MPVPHKPVQKLPSGNVSTIFPSSSTGRSRTSTIAQRAFGTSASSFASLMSSLPSRRRLAPIANWTASKRLVFPALFAPTSTVRSCSATSMLVRDRKSATRIAITLTPLDFGVLPAALGASAGFARSASVTGFSAGFGWTALSAVDVFMVYSIQWRAGMNKSDRAAALRLPPRGPERLPPGARELPASWGPPRRFPLRRVSSRRNRGCVRVA
jgi:hypothetical protein